MSRRLDRIDIGPDKQEFPAVLLLMLLDHLLDLVARIMPARVFHAVGRNYKHRMRRNVFRTGIFVNIRDVMYCPADRVDQCRAASHIILLFGQRFNFAQFYTVVDNFALVVEQHGRNVAFALFFFLPFDKRIKTADRILLKPRHGSASVKDKNQLSRVVLLLFFRIFLYFHFSFLP